MDKIKNNCTLIIDGNWLLLSRFSVVSENFHVMNSDDQLKNAKQSLIDMLAKSINIMLNRFPIIDNIVMVSDGGSWRKEISIPDSLKNTTYKGNRKKDEQFNWSYVFHSLNELMTIASKNNITVSTSKAVEGDDWIWFWTNKLNDEGINTIIWSSDNDLKQLINYNEDNNTFTAWYNVKNGLWISDKMDTSNTDPLDFFMNPQQENIILESLKRKSNKITYFNPTDIILQKIIVGDSGDNIKSVARFKKGNRTYKVTDNDWNKINSVLKIHSLDDLIKRREEAAKYISNYPKIKSHSISAKDIQDMIEYNIKLVWLDGKVIPKSLQKEMNTFDYTIADIPYIKNNYRTLAGDTEEDDYIQSLFNLATN